MSIGNPGSVGQRSTAPQSFTIHHRRLFFGASVKSNCTVTWRLPNTFGYDPPPDVPGKNGDVEIIFLDAVNSIDRSTPLVVSKMLVGRLSQ